MRPATDLGSPLVDSEIYPEQMPKVLTILDGFAESYPRAGAPRRLALDIVSGGSLRFLILSSDQS
jgi:hypothetical protein